MRDSRHVRVLVCVLKITHHVKLWLNLPQSVAASRTNPSTHITFLLFPFHERYPYQR